MGRRPGLSVRWKLTLSYAGFLLLAGATMLTVVWVFLLRYVPDTTLGSSDGFIPNRSDLQRAFGPAASSALILLVVFGLFGGWLLAGRMLAPLNKITQATRLAAEGSLSHRINLGGRGDEIRELADAFDAMLAQVEAHVGEQQRFAANASHELRTPLAVTRTLLEVASQDPARDHAADLARLKRMNSRAIDLTEKLLLLSRALEGTIHPEPVDVSLLAEEASETLLDVAQKFRVAIDVTGERSIAYADPVLLLQLVTNLMHNAIVHNAPDGGTVKTTTRQHSDHCSLVIENTGAQLDERQLATFVEPFQRGSHRVRDDKHDGTGLGLAISARIVQAHRGSMRLVPRAGGGLEVHIELPTSGPQSAIEGVR